MLTTAVEAQTKQWKIALHVDPNISWLKPDNKNLTAGENQFNFGFGVSIDKISNNFYTNYRPYGFSGDNKIYSEEKLVNRLNKYLGEDKITHYIYENGTLVFPTWAKLENIDL